MKVLVAHNRYQSSQPSGENAVVDADIAMLREAGVEVIPFIKDSDSLVSTASKLKAATGPVWSPAVRELAQLLDDEKPDVLHLHNVYPLISPWAVRTAQARGVRVVQTLHNYRHICVEGQQFRSGGTCSDCSSHRWSLPAIKHGCYRGSRLQSAAMAVGTGLHRRTWESADRLLCVSAAQRQALLDAGWPRERLHVKPNAVADPGPPTPLGSDVAFLGRLTEAKGVNLLLASWAGAPTKPGRLLIAGDGPLRGLVESAAASDHTIEYAGTIASEAVGAFLRRAALVVVPSVWEETFGLVAVEALAHGRPVLATDVPALREIVTDDVGWLVARDAPLMGRQIAGLSRDELEEKGSSARAAYESRYTTQVVAQQLLQHYDEVVTGR